MSHLHDAVLSRKLAAEIRGLENDIESGGIESNFDNVQVGWPSWPREAVTSANGARAAASSADHKSWPELRQKS